MAHPRNAWPAAALILLAGLAGGVRGQTYPDKIAAALKTVDDAAGWWSRPWPRERRW
ncbi:MAG: hypothetical protein ABSA30_02095 [Candidatus Aminicenantales bacterium]|jgi:hypothetical protein